MDMFTPALRMTHYAENLLARFARFAFVLLLAMFSIAAWYGSRSHLIWYDELLSLHVATAPTASDIVPWLATGIDFNPPLYHLLERGSVRVFGNNVTAARLPAFLGFG